LACALLHSVPILVLDEPTAHLDALTEREVLGEIVRAGEGRATLLVTHRLVALEAFDEVLVLERGCVAEWGPAGELLARSGFSPGLCAPAFRRGPRRRSFRALHPRRLGLAGPG
jgi:ABC-type transport system involved in cytochrome bd biosynthesis fused ATPase/permease subunit